MKNSNQTSFRYRYWQQAYRKLSQRIERAIQNGNFSDWSEQKVRQIWTKMQKLSERLQRNLKPALLASFISTGLIVKKEALATTLPEENPFNFEPEFRKLQRAYREKAYLHYDHAKIDPTANLDWRPVSTKNSPVYQLNREQPRIIREPTAIHQPIAGVVLPMQSISMDSNSDFGANYGIYGGSLDYRLTNPSDPNDPPDAPSQPHLLVPKEEYNNLINSSLQILPLLTGTAQQGTSITLESNLDGVLAANIEVDKNGRWQLQLNKNLSAGEHQIIAKASNSKGTSESSKPLMVFGTALSGTGNTATGTDAVVAGGSGAFATSSNLTSNSPGNLTMDDFVFGSDSLQNKVLTGTADDARFFFDKSKAAWRAGISDGDVWDEINVGLHSTVTGGRGNKASLDYTTVSGGSFNQATAENATISGGFNNKATAEKATVGGGGTNEAKGRTSTIGGGNSNIANGDYATIGGGESNVANGDYTVLGGGKSNEVSYNYTTVGGGNYNYARAAYSTIPGGKYLKATSYGETVIGVFNDISNISPNKTAFIATDRLFVIGNGTGSDDETRSNALVMLKNGNTQLNGVLSLSNGTDTLTLPNTKGTNGQVLTSDGAGNAVWQNAAGGGSGAFITSNNITSNSPGNLAMDDFVFGSDSLQNKVLTGTADDARFFFDKSKGAWRAGKVVGDQWDDTNVGTNSTVAGGKNNKASGNFATIGGGTDNQATGYYNSTVGGGIGNIVSGSQSTVGGGSYNTISADYSTIAGGYKNQAISKYANIGGGKYNKVSGLYATVGGGQTNEANGTHSTVAGGRDNQANKYFATVSGGTDNITDAGSSNIGGGSAHRIDANSFNATIGGGQTNEIKGAARSTISGGSGNFINANYGTIPGGLYLSATSYGQIVLGMHNDTTNFNPSKTEFIATDPLLVIGNGYGNEDGGGGGEEGGGEEGLRGKKNKATSRSFMGDVKSNALVMLKNGNTQLNGVLSLSNGTDTLALPNTKGNNGQVLTSDGTGNAIWQNAAGGGSGAFVTSNNITSNSPGDLTMDDFVFGSDSLQNKVLTGTSDDARFFFDKSKSAWRAGIVTGDQWDDSNIGLYSTVSGGRNNKATNYRTTVGGGRDNSATGNSATVGGGIGNNAIGSTATIGGGSNNNATASGATVGGGFQNNASGIKSIIAGGAFNDATNDYATVGGGGFNYAIAPKTTIGGGYFNYATAAQTTIGGGYINKATAYQATVGGGYKNQATANNATIPGGKYLGATSYGETAIGIFNDTIGISPNKTGITLTDRLFVIGNGADDSNRSNALIMLKNGNTQLNGILSLSNGTDTLALPNTKGSNGQVLTSDGTGNAVWQNAASGAFTTSDNITSNSPGDLTTDDFVFGSDSLQNKVLTGAADDARFFFDKSKAAWRAGQVVGDQWDDANVGFRSTVAGGKNNKASGDFATIGGGSDNQATGYYNSTVGGGIGNIVSGSQATVGGGSYNTASADYTTIGGGHKNQAISHYANIGGGKYNKVSGLNATVGGGYKNYATASNASVGGGRYNQASATSSTIGGGDNNKAIQQSATVGGGKYNQAYGFASMIGGGSYNKANANFATIPGGYQIGATSFAETAFGTYNDTTGISPNKTAFIATDRLFVIGNGTDDSNRSNALIMLKNGNLGLGNPFGSAPTTPTESIEHANGAKLTTTGIWMNASDRNRKTNIEALEYGLKELLKLKAVEYDYKSTGDHSIGFIAQEVEKVFPELVAGEEGNKALAYDLLTAVIVKAMQEMETENEQLKAESEQLQVDNQQSQKINAEQELEIDTLQTMVHQLQAENNRLQQVENRMAKLEQLMSQLTKVENRDADTKISRQ